MYYEVEDDLFSMCSIMCTGANGFTITSKHEFYAFTNTNSPYMASMRGYYVLYITIDWVSNAEYTRPYMSKDPTVHGF